MIIVSLFKFEPTYCLRDNRLSLIECLLKNTQPREHAVYNAVVYSVLEIMVPNVDQLGLLAKSVNPAYTLLNAYRVSRQFIIDQHTAELETHILRADFDRTNTRRQRHGQRPGDGLRPAVC